MHANLHKCMQTYIVAYKPIHKCMQTYINAYSWPWWLPIVHLYYTGPCRTELVVVLPLACDSPAVCDPLLQEPCREAVLDPLMLLLTGRMLDMLSCSERSGRSSSPRLSSPEVITVGAFCNTISAWWSRGFAETSSHTC